MLSVENLYKTYAWSKSRALDNISLKVDQAEFVALLGPNWAWKSSFINTLVWNISKDSWSISIDGINLDTNELETKNILWVVPQEINHDSFFNINEVLNNQSWYFGIKNNQEYIDYLLEELSLSDKKYSNTRRLSGGMKRRLLIAKALVHKPRLLILDEPTAWVDIELRLSLYRFLKKLHNQWITIILTTHYLEEAEALCDRIVIINDWKIIADQAKHELLKRLWWNARISFMFDDNVNKEDIQILSRFNPIVENNSLIFNIQTNKLDELFHMFCEKDIKYQSVKIDEERLEDVFLKLVNK